MIQYKNLPTLYKAYAKDISVCWVMNYKPFPGWSPGCIFDIGRSVRNPLALRMKSQLSLIEYNAGYYHRKMSRSAWSLSIPKTDKGPTNLLNHE
jgi:hypothetical protein